MDGTLSTDLALIRPLVSPAPVSLATTAAPHVTLLMRDGSRLNIELADPQHQARDLAARLAPRSAQVREIELEDRSTLLLPAADILGVRLPPPVIQPKQQPAISIQQDT